MFVEQSSRLFTELQARCASKTIGTIVLQCFAAQRVFHTRSGLEGSFQWVRFGINFLLQVIAQRQARLVADAGATEFIASVVPVGDDSRVSLQRSRDLLKGLVGKV